MGEVVVVFPNRDNGSVGRGVDKEGGVGAPGVGVQVKGGAAAEECRNMMASEGLIPNVSWGTASKEKQKRWDRLGCNALVAEEEVQPVQRNDPTDCTARPSQPSDPLIAICAGTTTRRVPLPNEETLALFRFLLPSLARTADCGFNYLAVIGYDVGDEFFDGEAARAKVRSWFDAEVTGPAALRGINIELELVRVQNEIDKPGPVFAATTQVAYERGANYIYRVNDDSEMVEPWARLFVDTLEAMGPPYGVVGPESQNANILVHDFTHRLHMDIFEGQYYPPVLTDWYVDDWISRIYGNRRTIRAKNCRVEHHTEAHGQRYVADASKGRNLGNLVRAGARKVADWARDNGQEEAANQIMTDRLDGQSAKRMRARIIPPPRKQ